MYSRFGSTWRSVQIGDLIRTGALVIGDGYRVTNVELGESGTPFVRGGDIRDGRVFTDVADHIRPEFEERISGKLSQPEDVVFITKGTVGRVGYLRSGQPQVVFAPQVCYWRVIDRKVLHPRFVFYLLQGREFQANLEAVKTHGSMLADYVSLSDQRRFRLTLPPIDVQENIADTIGALDDKVEINRQVNQTLEAIARAIFKSWFVDFDPVREGLPLFPRALVASSLGQIPEAWDVGVLGDIAENPRRGVAPAEVDPGTAYIGLEHMPRGSIALGQWEDSDGLESNKFRFLRGEILFGKLRPYFHKVGVAAVDGICSTDILVVVPRQDAYFGFVLALVSSEDFVQYADRGSAGTKMPRTNWSDMARYRTVIPPEPIAQAFTEIVKPMVEKIAANILESRTLAALRDALLPKLLSGEIRVKQAEKIVGEAV